MKLDTRQKILIPLIIIAFIYVGWQIYHLFFVSSSNQALSHPIALANASPGETIAQPDLQIERDQLVLPEHKTIAKLSSQAATDQSTEYQRLANQYRELEAKRMLLEEKMAIANTEHKIAELNAKLSKFDNTGMNTSFDKERAYKLIYLDRQNGIWSATLRDNNTFLEVKPGTKLSDGSRAVAIDSKGVVLVKNGKTDLLTFTGIVPIRKAQKVLSPRIQKIVKPSPAKVVIQNAEKRKISMSKSTPPKRIQPQKISKVARSTKNPILTEKTPITPDYTIKPVPSVANYSVRPVQSVSLPEPLVKTNDNSVTVVKLSPKQIKPKSSIANYSVKPVKLTLPKQQQFKLAKNKTTTAVKLTPEQVEPKPTVADYSVRPVENNNIAVVQLTPKRRTEHVKSNPLVANYSVKPVEKILMRKQPIVTKNADVKVNELVIPKNQLKHGQNKHTMVIKHITKKSAKLPITSYSVKTVKSDNNVTVVQLAPKNMKSVKPKKHTTKLVDLTYKEKITPLPQLKSSASKTAKHVGITQLIPKLTKSSDKIAKVSKPIEQNPSVHKRRMETNQSDNNRPVGFSPLPPKNNVEQDNNGPIILMN